MPLANSLVTDAFWSATWHLLSVTTPLASGETVVHDQTWDGTQGCGEIYQLQYEFKYLVIHS
jgi:hypothetical protein